jgi:phosphate transport system permease protein
VGSAIYLSEIASTNVREALKPFIEILAGIPSVIYGLFGMAVLAPLVRKLFNVPTGLNLFSASIILGIMIIPIISSLSEDALSAVSKELREASLALGANRIETIFKVVLPAASSGVISSIILGFGRAIGETMVVLMVSGGAAMLPKSIFSPVRPMTSAIASEMGEAVNGSQHFQALYGIAIVLFLITFLSSLLMQWFAGRENRE